MSRQRTPDYVESPAFPAYAVWSLLLGAGMWWVRWAGRRG